MGAEHLAETMLTLPGGVILDDGRRLCHANLRPLTGREEQWLADHPGAPSVRAVTRLLSACLLWLDDLSASRELVEGMLVGDRDYLIFQLRRATLGETIRAVLTCPACNARMDVDVQADDVPVERRPQTTAVYSLAVGGPQAPVRTVRFRLPTGADQEAVLGLDVEEAVDALLQRCLIDDGGAPLAPDERSAVIEAMDNLAPQLDLELDLICPECDHAFVAPFDITSFFFGELRASSAQLLREIHYLALYYHWSEAEILGLTRTRRREYLALLSETMQRE